MWLFVLGFILGAIVGCIAVNIIFIRKETSGDLVVVDDEREPRPYIFLNINHEDLDGLMNQQVVKFSVDRRKPRRRHNA